ncbi:MarR family winged helix-turn-helix transcriptional regulator [Thermoplasma volcanium]|nr:MarR family transcriptional regulator [Thermoplasma volcanium]
MAYDDDENSMAIKVWRLYVDLWKLWYKKNERNLNKIDLSITEFTIMRHLIENGPMSMAAIASLINVTPGWITGVVDKMEEKNLVTRNRDSTDRRIIKIAITDRGREVYENAKKNHYAFIRKALAELNENELQQTYVLLQKMMDDVSKLESN